MQVLIKNVKQFGTVAIQGVHQVVDHERDIDRAIDEANHHGFNRVIFYFHYHSNWMVDTDFRVLVKKARESIRELDYRDYRWD